MTSDDPFAGFSTTGSTGTALVRSQPRLLRSRQSITRPNSSNDSPRLQTDQFASVLNRPERRLGARISAPAQQLQTRPGSGNRASEGPWRGVQNARSVIRSPAVTTSGHKLRVTEYHSGRQHRLSCPREGELQ